MLRSVKSLEGFSIGATDGTIGKIEDFYFDDEAWVIRYAKITIDFDRQAIKDSPSYDEGALIERDAGPRIYNHYGR